MTLLVVDASVVVKWFIAEENSEEALRLLDREKNFFAPDHLFAETTNAVWKKVRRGEISREDGREALSRIDNAALAITSVPCLQLAADAYSITLTYGRSVYDAMYLALAIQNNTRLVTADVRLFNALATAPDIRPHIELLREYSS